MIFFSTGECTALKSLKRFCHALINVYGNKYLQTPNEDNFEMIISLSEERGFPGMMGSLGCMQGGWKNFPVEDHRQYS